MNNTMSAISTDSGYTVSYVRTPVTTGTVYFSFDITVTGDCDG